MNLLRLSKLQRYWDEPEYWEESWRLEETCCYSDSRKRSLANPGVKSLLGIIIIINRTRIRKQKWEEKQRLISNISHEKNWTWQRKGNLKAETESLPKAAQNNVKRTNHTKARIDKTRQNSRCRLCDDRDEAINHIISECSKLALKEYKTRHDWVNKVIHWEIRQKFEFDYTNKWYIHNPASVLENDTHKFPLDFNIQTDHLISAKRPDLIIINNNKKKRTCKNVDFAVLADHRVKLKESEKDEPC